MSKSTQMLINEKLLEILRELQGEVKDLKEQNKRLLDACNDMNRRIYELSLAQSQPNRYQDPVRPIGPYYDDFQKPWLDPNKVWCKTETHYNGNQARLLDDKAWNSLKSGGK